METEGPTVDELIDAATERGYAVTRWRVDRWHKARLLPRRQQLHRRGVRGSEGRYPAGTTEQFLALCHFHQIRKKLDEAGFWLWWYGYDVDPSWGKRALLTWLGPIPDPPKLEPDVDLSDIAEEQTKELLAQEADYGLVHDVRRHFTNEEDVSSVVQNVILATLGERPEWTSHTLGDELGEPSLQALIFQGLGMSGMITDKWRETFPNFQQVDQIVPWFFDYLTSLKLWDFSGFVTVVHGLHDSDLARIRGFWRVATKDLSPMDRNAPFPLLSYGRDALRLRVFTLFIVALFAFTTATLCRMYGLPEAHLVQRSRASDTTRWTRVLIRFLSIQLTKPDSPPSFP